MKAAKGEGERERQGERWSERVSGWSEKERGINGRSEKETERMSG